MDEPVEPEAAQFLEEFWTVPEVIFPRLDALHLRDRLRSDLSKGRDHPVTWGEIFQLNSERLNIHPDIYRAAVPEFTFAFQELAAAWLISQFPAAPARKILAVSQAIGELASEESAYGPPADQKSYDRVFALAEATANLATAAGTDDLLAKIVREFFSEQA